MAITNLTNTTWYVPAGWKADAGYGRFSVYGYSEDLSPRYPTIYDFNIGYQNDSKTEHTISGYYGDGEVFVANSSQYFSVTFEGGDDIKNPELIAWLETNGELQGGEEEPTAIFDLSTLNLTAGTHSIAVKARAKGYIASMLSEKIEYVVEGGNEPEEPEVDLIGTWVLNDTIIPVNGTYKVPFAKGDVRIWSKGNGDVTIGDGQSLYLGSGNSYVWAFVDTATTSQIYPAFSYSKAYNDWVCWAYEDGGFMFDDPVSISFNAYPTDNVHADVLLDWLKANATKQGASEPKYQLAINYRGTIYYWDVDSPSALWLSLNGKYDTTNTYYINCPYASSSAKVGNSNSSNNGTIGDSSGADVYGDYNYNVNSVYTCGTAHSGGSGN